jgi:hypothetical protein
MSKQYEAIMVEADLREEFRVLKESEHLTNTEVLEKLMNFYQANSETK